MEVIARIHNDFPTKFGLPRQSGLAPSLRSKIVFEPAFRIPEALRGLDGFSHIWLIWGFSESEGWSPTVRPPRLGGNVRMGVFATRSPFRPNPIGLSSVRLEGIETDGENGLVLIVTGADLMDGTPIYDIKPYLPGVDAHPEATDGFVGAHPQTLLTVELDPSLTAVLSAGQQAALREILAQDPRPAYHAGQPDSGRIYGLSYAGRDIHFTVCDGCIKAW
ncbi:MAG: tRNA (N6-threonylcarbamoyladenosine(37)-N6)-methyltransferase TrmO [Bacteroidales bacterium]|nr:tRNA (N6-threonylcarbamoyladenosine(37)-N6)-methyltransferase TrmO [Bacteroidales bacterium]